MMIGAVDAFIAHVDDGLAFEHQLRSVLDDFDPFAFLDILNKLHSISPMLNACGAMLLQLAIRPQGSLDATSC